MVVDDSSFRNVFFFGAGASVKAGVNTTFGLVDEFRTFLKPQTDLFKTFQEILVILSENGHKVDIEELLQTIDRLEKRHEDKLINFYESSKLKVENPGNLPKIKDELKNFINRVTTVGENKINYLEPLFSYPKPTLIFSVNYDTAIEQLCNVYKKKYSDGFEYSWNPELFQNNNLDFHLYKLHGSIMWYKTDRGDYIKLPLPPQDNKIKLIFGEEANHLMLYPMRKWEFDEPLLAMMQKFREYLEKVETVIVVGYSFRDPYMVKIFHDAARKNRNLKMILIDPKARQIYENKLLYFQGDENVSIIPSSLENRVLCLQYKFEEILSFVDEYSNNLRRGWGMEEQCKEKSYAGNMPDWFRNNGPVFHYVNSEFIDGADLLIHKVDWDSEIQLNSNDVMVSSFKMFLLAEEHERQSVAKWLNIFLLSSKLLSVSKFNLRYSTDEHFSYSFLIDKTSSRPFSSLYDPLLQMVRFYIKKSNVIPKDSLSEDLGIRVTNLFNFIVLRQEEVTMTAITDPKFSMDIDKNSEISSFNNAISEFSTGTNTSNSNFTPIAKLLESKRLANIIGKDSFHDYFIHKYKSDTKKYEKYLDYA